LDFYKLRFGGQLALKDIDPHRLGQYKSLAKKLTGRKPVSELDKFLISFSHIFLAQMKN